METPREIRLSRKSYSELKKYAQKIGIKRKLKAEALISLILEKEKASAEDSFVTLENEIMNSCKKNKEKKFVQDKEVASDTPRRETYTLERPTGDVIAMDNDLIVSSASPVLKKTPATNETSFNVTMSRGSERKKKRKVSFVTPMRKSARLSAMTPHYASVKDRPKTPIPSRGSSGRRVSSSVKAKISFAETPSEKELGSSNSKRHSARKGRVSTPMPSSKCKRMNLSSSGLNAPMATPEVSFSDPPQEKIPEEPKSDVKKPGRSVFKFSAGTPDVERIVTPTPKLDFKEVDTPSASDSAKVETRTPKSDIEKTTSPHAVNPKNIRTLTPRSNIKKTATPLSANPKNIRTLTPRSNIKRTATPVSANPKNLRTLTPRSQVKKNATPFSVDVKNKRTPRSGVKSATTPGVLSASKVKIPNFKELHQKQFNKMESIDEYQQRKAVLSAKKIKEQVDYNNRVKSSASKKVASKNKGIIKFGGIPFIPSVTSTKDMKLDASTFGARCVANKKRPAATLNDNVSFKKTETPAAKEPRKILTRENTPLKKRFRFDLQASLTKKLPYKPHKGPIKPLAEKNQLNTSVANPALTKPATQNKFVEAKRVESRNVLRGVRVNRRFELQMQKRKLA